MPKTTSLFNQLLPAAFATSAFAALAHALLVAVAARSIGLELIYIGAISFIVALVISFVGGAVLLAVVGVLKLNLVVSFVLFVVAIQAVAIWVEMTFFEIGLNDISWVYGFISVPASLIAWHQSVYYVHMHI